MICHPEMPLVDSKKEILHTVQYCLLKENQFLSTKWQNMFLNLLCFGIEKRSGAKTERDIRFPQASCTCNSLFNIVLDFKTLGKWILFKMLKVLLIKVFSKPVN